MCIYFLKGISVIDCNKTSGENAAQTLEKKFGPNKVIFVEADVSNEDEFESK